ncbi:MAG: hypothetical protein R3E64_05140 [Halioglobus sp.]
MSKSWIVLFTIVLCFMNQSAQASPITLDSDATGSLSKTVGCLPVACVFESYASTNPLVTMVNSFTVTFPAGRPATAQRTDKGYAAFDLSSLSQTVLSAKFQVSLRYTAAATSTLSVRAVDSATAAALVANPVGTQSAEFSVFDPPPPPPLYDELLSQYSALSAGIELGMLEQHGPFNGVFEIDLSDAALNLINAGGGLFALALNWSSNLVGSNFSRFDSIAFNGAPRLILNTGGSHVPNPATFWLVGAALVLLTQQQRRSDSRHPCIFQA